MGNEESQNRVYAVQACAVAMPMSDIISPPIGVAASPIEAAVAVNLVINWPEFQRMLKNIGWNGGIPDTSEDCKTNDRELYNLLLEMIKKKINPTKVRNKQTFMNEMKHECFKGYQQYIGQHLN